MVSATSLIHRLPMYALIKRSPMGGLHTLGFGVICGPRRTLSPCPTQNPFPRPFPRRPERATAKRQNFLVAACFLEPYLVLEQTLKLATLAAENVVLLYVVEVSRSELNPAVGVDRGRAGWKQPQGEGLVHQTGTDVDFRSQCAMHRAFTNNLKEPQLLLLGQCAGKFELPFNPVD
jgi:hypothetical protein